MPELKPLFRRYWVKILPDGSAISQFDPDGKYTQWHDNIPAKRIMFLPFSLEFAEKVRSKGDDAEASNLPILVFDVTQKSAAWTGTGALFNGCHSVHSIVPNVTRYHRNVVIRQQMYTVCRFCGATLNSDTTQCPRCLGRNWYYCDKCDSLKARPIVKLELQTFGGVTKWISIPHALLTSAIKIAHCLPGRWGVKNVQILCPDCVEPRGLMSVNCIIEEPEQTIKHTHDIEIDGKRHLITDLVAQ